MWRSLQNILGKVIRKENVKCCRKSKFEQKRSFSFIWTLENFGDVRGKPVIISPLFVDEHSTHAWRLKLTQTNHRASMNSLGFYLMYEGKHAARPYFAITICIMDSDEKILHAFSADGDYSVMLPRRENGFDSFLEMSNLYRVIGNDDALHLYCSIVIEELICVSDGPSKTLSVRQTQMQTLSHLKNFETVVLETKNGPIPAIKNILAARSPVFATMFEESSKVTVKVEDFDTSIVQGMLDYVYTGRTGSLWNSATDLLQIADKYQILDLKKECEEVVETNLTIHNAAKILIIANLHSPDNLKPKVVDFIHRFINDAQNGQCNK